MNRTLGGSGARITGPTGSLVHVHERLKAIRYVARTRPHECFNESTWGRTYIDIPAHTRIHVYTRGKWCSTDESGATLRVRLFTWTTVSESLRLSYYALLRLLFRFSSTAKSSLADSKASGFLPLFARNVDTLIMSLAIPRGGRKSERICSRHLPQFFPFQLPLTIVNHRIISHSPNFLSYTGTLWIDLPISRCLRDELLLVLPIDRHGMVIAMIINGNNWMANKAGLVSVEDREVVRRRQESGSHSIQSHPRFTGHHPGRIRATLRWLFCNIRKDGRGRQDPLFVAAVPHLRRKFRMCIHDILLC